MRVYALLLGALLTVGSAYVMQVAVEYAGCQPAAAIPGELAHPAGPDPIRYGGTIDPITVSASVRLAPPPPSPPAPAASSETHGGNIPSSTRVSDVHDSIACARRVNVCGSMHWHWEY